MEKIAAILLAFGIFGVSAAAQSTRSVRPRVVATPAGEQQNSASPETGKRPPVLVNRNAADQVVVPVKTEEKSSEEDEIIRVETNLVTLPVSVLDRDGRFIPNLRQQDFQILENGVAQKIEHFQPVEQPFTVVLMLDVSPSTRYQINEIRLAAIRFVEQLRPNDRVMVIAFDERTYVLCQPTNDRRVLRYAITRANFGEGTGLYQAVDFVVNQQIPLIEGRKAVVLFSDGVDTTSYGADYQSTLHRAEEVDALFYPIHYDTMGDMKGGNTFQNPSASVRGLGGISGIIVNGQMVPVSPVSTTGTSNVEYETGSRYLEDLARTSGGRIFKAENNLDAAFAGIAEELRRQYSIGYYPETEGQPGERRQITIRVKRPNMVVRSKNSYVFGANIKSVAGQ